MRLRLNHFLPFLASGKHGLVRRALGRLGPGWLAAPWSRLAQAACLLLFLVLLGWVAWPYGPPDYAMSREGREFIDAEIFLALDPLVSVTTAVAGRTWVWSLAFAAAMLATGLLVPRGFCGCVCPLGTIIDLFDWVVGRRITRFRVARDGPWVNLKYCLLAGVLAASVFGVLLGGFVAAIPVVTRGLIFVLGPIHSGLARGWYLVPPMNAGHAVSIALFLAVLAMSLWRPRFWCRHVCPTGAVFSAFNALRAAERQVESTCIDCGLCVKACPFDAIKADFTTRAAECTFCQTCGGACPTRSIRFAGRWETGGLKPASDTSGRERPVSRRGFLSGTAAGLAAALAVREAWGRPAGPWPLRPPGSVPEELFLRLCIRCGECFRACPNDVLHPLAFEHGLDGLWTPAAKPRWSGCDPKCNNCGHVCPTGAIRALPLEEKAAARMGLAVLDERTCLPWAAREACRMCVDECSAAGYRAIEFRRVHVEVDGEGRPAEGSGFAAPVVLADRCVGCGLCETRCHGINVEQKGLLRRTAVEVLAGPGREDRLTSGSYVERRRKADGPAPASPDDYLPDFLKDK